jgi:hypothetical protein
MTTLGGPTATTDPIAHALENQFGLADTSGRRGHRSPTASPASVSRASRCPPSPSWPTRARRRSGVVGDARQERPRRPQPVARALVQRLGGNRVDVPDHVVLRQVAHRCREPDHRRLRRPLPDDHRAQGARRVRVPRAARRHRPVRPHPPPRHLAEHRQLRPRRHRHQPHHGLPWRRDPARGHEPGALRLARRVV